MQVFRIDGKDYQVDVVQLKREFSIPDTDNTGRTMDGVIYREPIGTYRNYTLVIRPRPGMQADMDALWNLISQPEISHICTFPYGQHTLTQRMYITGGEQPLLHMDAQGVTWGDVTVHFTALCPTVEK